jgi:alpha-N-arabinofuranosidase
LGAGVVAAELADVGPRVYTSVTRDEKQRKLFIKIVNANSDAKRLDITLEGLASVKHEATMTTLSGKSPEATNSITHPDNIVPVKHQIELRGPKFEHEFEPYSINVLDLSY